MNKYIGNWISLKELNRPIKIGDLVMIETLEDTLVVEVYDIKNETLWHYNNWIIPVDQIMAIKQR